MPQVNWSIDIGGILLALVALILIPTSRVLLVTLWEMRDTIRDLGHIVVGNKDADSTSLVTRMNKVELEIRKHRDRLITIEADSGLKIQDQT